MANFGIMEGAYFVGRGELLTWVNEVFKFEMTRVEECATGAPYCQFFDACHPGSIALHKVNFNARQTYEFVQNYKELQLGFDRVNLKKGIDVEKLIKAKFQDNLEFLQWFKRYYDSVHDPNVPYDAIGRREAAIAAFSQKHPSSARRQTMMPTASLPLTSAAPSSSSSVSSSKSSSGSRAASSTPPPSSSSSSSSAARKPAAAVARPVTASTTARSSTAAASTKADSSSSSSVSSGRAASASSSSTAKSSSTSTSRTSATTTTAAPRTKAASSSSSAPSTAAAKKVADPKIAQLETQLKQKGDELEQMAAAVLKIEKDRDFYYDKLSHLEKVLNIIKSQFAADPLIPTSVLDDLLHVLYAGPSSSSSSSSAPVQSHDQVQAQQQQQQHEDQRDQFQERGDEPFLDVDGLEQIGDTSDLNLIDTLERDEGQDGEVQQDGEDVEDLSEKLDNLQVGAMEDDQNSFIETEEPLDGDVDRDGGGGDDDYQHEASDFAQEQEQVQEEEEEVEFF